jgi:FAD/FMN-containing dehydrogenase/uncharacterized membrane protein YhaH (DUF805 family)
MITKFFRLFFSFDGVISRSGFWITLLISGYVFAILFTLLEATVNRSSTFLLYPFLFWIITSLAVRRLRDRGKSAKWLLLGFVPLLGPLWLFIELGFCKSRFQQNKDFDYLTVKHENDICLLNDVTDLNPILVSSVLIPSTIEEIQTVMRTIDKPISIGGGCFSMGGQIASPDSVHFDMRKLNKILEFSPVHRTIRIQSGIRWCDIQQFIDPHNLSVKIMQTYANFTVGGSLSVNAHGRYNDLGPLILSVRALSLILANGEQVEASPTQNAELFYGAIGGYGGLGIIVEAELDLTENARVERVAIKLQTKNYITYFRKQIRGVREAIFHNADLYAPNYTQARSVTWYETQKPVTQAHRLQPYRWLYLLENYFLWAVSETPFGKWRREFIIDPIIYLRSKVHWRNYEAGYDAAELEPSSRKHQTYVLQEYFVPVEKFDVFVPKMAEILQRYNVNVLNISIRHAMPDSGSLLAWARQEVFAFVLYYKQGTQEWAKNHVAVWTRELIEAALGVQGSYYLPYQVHATPEQFHRAYPRAKEFFELKHKLDPNFRFRNVLWNKYYTPTLNLQAFPEECTMPNSDFFKRFIQIRYHKILFINSCNISIDSIPKIVFIP